MNDGAGYRVDVAYPGRFHRETMPLWLHTVATALGRAAPDLSRPYRMCELGCGDGLNLLLAAACNPLGEFVGLDLDSQHIDRARATAHEAGLGNVRFMQADAGDAAVGDALADGEGFDFVASHGMWSWIPAGVRAAATTLAARVLRPGGIASIGYMSHPGASVLASLQRLMREYAATRPGDAASRAVDAVAFARRLAQAGSGLFAEHPGLARQLEAMAAESPAHLAHEFLSGHWEPLHAADVIGAFAARGCEWIGSGTPLDNIDALSLPGQVLPLLREATAPALAETLKDAARHQSLRRDLFQREGRALTAEEHLAAIDRTVLAAAPGAPVAGPLTLHTRIGPVQAPAGLVDPLLRRLARGPASCAELRGDPAFAVEPRLLNQLVQALLWSGAVHPLRGDTGQTPGTARLAHLLAARDGEGCHWRPWPQAGTAIGRGSA